MNDRAILVAAVSVGSMVAVATGMVGQRCWPGPAGDLRQVAEDYQSLHRMTKEPNGITLRLSRLCSVLPEGSWEAAERACGPHAEVAIHVYMNDRARQAFESEGDYPVGSMIVKEKFDLTLASDRNRPPALGRTGIGGMIKRAPGYNSDHGDWEYFFVGDGEPWTSGRLTNCMQCHDVARESDYVFGGWKRPI